ncbi:hypothetical protein GCM10007897_45090 [Sphingobium jiangsuense]|uniref:hypothetical protein n=1 Tax=Sphingobium jiangsuense TaxID=870476 RepID=UPI00235C89D1|nr:hypothetical protein [Sphingobium jiangsuense]GLT03066.1 hypothetical protein GCM10007897_45090 [Sphingobium jiangsuense]
MGFLDGGISAIFGAALSGLYLDGTLHRDGTNPVYDQSGNIVGYSGGVSLPIKVQRDACSWSMKQSPGYVDGDVMLIVLAHGLAATITTDMEISDGAWQAVDGAKRRSGRRLVALDLSRASGCRA